MHAVIQLLLLCALLLVSQTGCTSVTRHGDKGKVAVFLTRISRTKVMLSNAPPGSGGRTPEMALRDFQKLPLNLHQTQTVYVNTGDAGDKSRSSNGNVQDAAPALALGAGALVNSEIPAAAAAALIVTTAIVLDVAVEFDADASWDDAKDIYYVSQETLLAIRLGLVKIIFHSDRSATFERKDGSGGETVK